MTPKDREAFVRATLCKVGLGQLVCLAEAVGVRP